MPEINTYLCEKNNFLREGIKSFLLGSDFKVVAEIEQISDIKSTENADFPDLIVLGASNRIDCPLLKSDITLIRADFPNTRLVLLVTQEDCSGFPNLILLNFDGYILRDITKRAFLDYLDLVIIGEKIIPAFALNVFVESNAKIVSDAKNILAIENSLSAREIDIIKLLREGCSNKLIARKLDISESTVKVHLKSVLRKLGMQNRTQIAIWSMSIDDL